ncbi:MAG TPA: cupredoxin domain-containing protein [Actinomycetota bacterium]|nr:cupredoxin domain-containing protein [Actinomycetota bacterium]
MKRWMLLCAVAATALVLGLPTVSLAGGGCHGGATHQDSTGEDGATVEMVDACFSAAITEVDPGTPVTFVNLDDGITHNVGGTLWGNFEDMFTGDTYTATFDDPGIYPFACNYHPGMTGAIVVGGGEGAGNGAMVSTTPPELDTASSATTGSTTSPSNRRAPWIVVAGIGGLALGAAAAFGVTTARGKASHRTS